MCWGNVPDLQVTRADAEGERRAAVEASLAQGEPVYLTRDLPGASGQYSLDAAGPLILVSAKAQPEHRSRRGATDRAAYLARRIAAATACTWAGRTSGVALDRRAAGR